MLLKILEKLGRKYAWIDFYGDILSYRYYVFFYESHNDNRFLAKLPNIYIHIYNSDEDNNGPNLETSHSHPWSTLAFILKGSYTEIIDDSHERETKRFRFAFLSYKQRHKLIKAEQNTVSIFMHWFKKDSWKIYTSECKTICDVCETYNNGKCNSKNSSNDFEEHLNNTHKSVADGRSWRALSLIKVDDKFDDLIKRRKKSLEKMGIKIPKTLKEKSRMIKIAQIEKKNEIK